MEDKKVVLSVKDLNVKFTLRGQILHAIRGISLDVYQGESLAIVGESGSGKSVFVKCAMGLLDANGYIDGGSILYNGMDLTKFQTDKDWLKIRGKEIAMVFQDPMTSLNPLKTIGKQIQEAVELHQGLKGKDAYKAVLEVLSDVGIDDPERRYKQYPHEFSGGMRQRVVIAIAVACRPKILICDEPTTALDVTIQAQILELIYKLRSEFNMAVLLITHDLGVVSEVADRVVVMYCGQVVEEGEKFELFEHPLHPYTLGLLRSIPRLEEQNAGRLYMIKGSVPNPLNMPAGCPFSDRCERCTDRCRTEAPQLKLLPGTTRKVRCHLYEDADEIARAVEATEAAHRVKAELEAQEREIIDQAAQAVRRGSAAQEGVR